jgi:hypothetical protein
LSSFEQCADAGRYVLLAGPDLGVAPPLVWSGCRRVVRRFREEWAVARIHYEADGRVPPERFIAALTDFSDRRPDLWPGLDTKFFKLHELGDTQAEVTEGTDVLGGVWARERYDWSQPGLVRLTLVDSADFTPGTVTEYRVTAGPAGGCHVAVDFRRIARSARGRFVGVIVQLTGARRFRGELRVALDRLSQVMP